MNWLGIVLGIGLGAFLVWQVIGLIRDIKLKKKAIKEREQKKAELEKQFKQESSGSNETEVKEQNK